MDELLRIGMVVLGRGGWVLENEEAIGTLSESLMLAVLFPDCDCEDSALFSSPSFSGVDWSNSSSSLRKLLPISLLKQPRYCE